MSSKLSTRLLRDVKNIMKSPLTSNGIYYVHSDTDMYKGYAMIIGPSDTPYEDGFYFFELNFPKDYPFQPPKLKYYTNDGITRFNPNLYKNGKVCISILNTWKGEQWTSCQTIRSILMTLVTLFVNNPLINEPGFDANHRMCAAYKDAVSYMNYSTAILGMITRLFLVDKFLGFYPIMKLHIEKKGDAIIERIKKLAKSDKNGKVISARTLPYSDMIAKLDYDMLLEKMTIAIANILHNSTLI